MLCKQMDHQAVQEHNCQHDQQINNKNENSYKVCKYIPKVKNRFWQRLKMLWRLSAIMSVDKSGCLTITPTQIKIKTDLDMTLYTILGNIDISSVNYNSNGKILLNSSFINQKDVGNV